jgi:hypothetical protein
MAGRSGGRVTPCVVCTVHKETRSAGFLVEPQNQGLRVSRLGPQNWQLRFSDLGLKITATVFWFGRSAWGTCRDLADCFAWKQVGLEFPNLASRLVEARLQVVYVASTRRSRGFEAEDGRVNATCCVEPFYPKIDVLIVLGPKGIVVF